MGGSSAAVYDAVRAVADAILEKPCATRLATSLLAAAVRSSISPSARFGSGGGLVDDLVDDRLNLIRPVLQAQTASGLDSGADPHTAKGLVDDTAILRANTARHVAFNQNVPLSKIPDKKLKQLQRGSRRAPNDDGTLDLIGQWQSVECPSIKVVRTPLGLYTCFDDNPKVLHKICSKDGDIELDGYRLVARTASTVQWTRDATEHLPHKELVWERPPAAASSTSEQAPPPKVAHSSGSSTSVT